MISFILAAFVALCAYLMGSYKERKKNKKITTIYDQKVSRRARNNVINMTQEEKLKRLMDE